VTMLHMLGNGQRGDGRFAIFYGYDVAFDIQLNACMLFHKVYLHFVCA
jgi:hypothetical protein